MIQSWDEYVEFPEEKIRVMRDLINDQKQSDKLKDLFVNRILREDVFRVLDACCTVIYYPFDKTEENDGFHVQRPVDYGGRTEEHFVCINTGKGLEKQVFAAAHELGHIWNMIELIWADGFEMPKEQRYTEAAMNRFAAELLMPEDIFKGAAEKLREQYVRDGTIALTDACRLVAKLMDDFCVPAQAVIFRLYETKCLSRESCEQWLITGPIDPPKISQKDYQKLFERLLKKCIAEGGYTRLLQPSRKKFIKDFPQILDEVEKRELFSEDRVQELREFLDIPVIEKNNTKLDLGD